MERSNEAAIRLICFASVFAVMALWEIAAPRRRLKVGKPLRWTSNLGLVALNTVIVRVVLPTGAVSMADIAHERGWGLFNNIELPGWAAVVLAMIILDLAIYLQHVMFHAVPILWRLHMVHHADLDFDVSTGLRFHTIEIVLSMGIKLAAVVGPIPRMVQAVISCNTLTAQRLWNQHFEHRRRIQNANPNQMR